MSTKGEASYFAVRNGRFRMTTLVRGKWVITGGADDDVVLADGVRRVEALMPHLEAWYRAWDMLDLSPYIRYNSRV